jgi:hypothetical protein
LENVSTKAEQRGCKMTVTVSEIEKAIIQLPPQQLGEFRRWYEQYDAAAWDRQIETDVAAGKLDALAATALADHRAGRSKKI